LKIPKKNATLYCSRSSSFLPQKEMFFEKTFLLRISTIFTNKTTICVEEAAKGTPVDEEVCTLLVY
jgi:hypothetical protein